MKKFFLLALVVLTLSIFCNNSFSQATAAGGIRIGVFDIDMMVQAMPEYRSVDSLTANYEQDSLGAQYQSYQSEYQRLDSTYKADSASKRPQSVLDYSKNLRQQMAFNLVYWQQISQQKSNDFRAQLAQPLYLKVVSAYKKVLAANKFTIILKPNSYEVGTPHLENIFPLVAKEMGVTLPQGLMGDPNQALEGTPGATTVPQRTTGKP